MCKICGLTCSCTLEQSQSSFQNDYKHAYFSFLIPTQSLVCTCRLQYHPLLCHSMKQIHFGFNYHHQLAPAHKSAEYLDHRQVTKTFCEGKQVHVGMEASKTNQTRWEWHHNTFTPYLHLVPFCHHLHKYALCFFVVWWVVVGSGGCVVRCDAHGECVMLWVAAM